MRITVQRVHGSGVDTIGILAIDGVFRCFVLEDEAREVKVADRTRIPAGVYRITLRQEGGFHQRYLTRFGPAFHRGMLWLRDVPQFEYILIHCGNRHEDTSGCLLVGDSCQQNVTEAGFLGTSTKAYRRVYPEIVAALVRGEEVTIEIRNEGRVWR